MLQSRDDSDLNVGDNAGGDKRGPFLKGLRTCWWIGCKVW